MTRLSGDVDIWYSFDPLGNRPSMPLGVPVILDDNLFLAEGDTSIPEWQMNFHQESPATKLHLEEILSGVIEQDLLLFDNEILETLGSSQQSESEFPELLRTTPSEGNRDAVSFTQSDKVLESERRPFLPPH